MTKKKKETKSEKTFTFGGRDIKVLNQKDDLIPQNADTITYSESDEKALALAITEDMPALLIGETGTGKTSVIRYLAHKRQQGYTRINMHGYNTPDELIGSKSVKNGATYYEDGILTNAMRKGHIVVLDELNATPPDCTFIIHGLLDDDKRVSLPNGEVITPHKDFRFFATMNPDYEGTRSLNRAFMDRFHIVLHIDILDPEVEKKLIIERTGVTEDLAKGMVNVAWMARKAYREHKTMLMISTRTLLQWALLIKQGLDNDMAFRTAVVNKSQSEETDAFLDFFVSVFGRTNSDKVKVQFELIDEKKLQKFKAMEVDYKLANEKIQKVEDEKKAIQDELEKARSILDDVKKNFVF